MRTLENGSDATEAERLDNPHFMNLVQDLDDIGITYLRGILMKMLLYSDKTKFDDDEMETIEDFLTTINWFQE